MQTAVHLTLGFYRPEKIVDNLPLDLYVNY